MALIFFLIVFISIWQIFADQVQGFIHVLPKPSAIFLQFVKRSDFFLWHSFITFQEILAILFLASLFAFVLAALMQRFPFIASSVLPFFVLIQSLPMFCLAPFFIFFFGWSFSCVVIVGALMIVFPLCLHFYQGLLSVPKRYLESFELYQASPWQVFWYLRLPFARGHFFAALRIAALNAGISAITAEWAGAEEGLGLLMYQSQRVGDLETSFLCFFLLSLLSFFLYCFSSFFEKRFLITSILCLCLSSCDTSADKTRLILDWFSNPNHVPLYYGLEKGFFEEEKIHLEIKSLADPSLNLSLLNSGKAQIALYYMPYALQAKSKGMDLKYLASLVSKPLDALMIADDEKIRTLDDLDGKRIAYSFGGLNEQYLSWLFQARGIRAQRVQGLSFSLAQALLSSRFDAIFGLCYNIESCELKSKGLKTRIFHFCDLGLPSYEELVFLCSARFLEKQPDFRERFMRALSKSINATRAQPEEAFAAYCRENQKSSKTLAWEKIAFEESLDLFTDEQFFRHELWQNFANWLSKESLIERELYAKDFL